MTILPQAESPSCIRVLPKTQTGNDATGMSMFPSFLAVLKTLASFSEKLRLFSLCEFRQAAGNPSLAGHHH